MESAKLHLLRKYLCFLFVNLIKFLYGCVYCVRISLLRFINLASGVYHKYNYIGKKTETNEKPLWKLAEAEIQNKMKTSEKIKCNNCARGWGFIHVFMSLRLQMFNFSFSLLSANCNGSSSQQGAAGGFT